MLKWEPSSNFLAQSAHTLSGIVFVLLSLIYESIWPFILFWIYMLVKEIFIDPKTEGEPFFWDGIEDCGFALLGTVLGCVLIIIKHPTLF